MGKKEKSATRNTTPQPTSYQQSDDPFSRALKLISDAHLRRMESQHFVGGVIQGEPDRSSALFAHSKFIRDLETLFALESVFLLPMRQAMEDTLLKDARFTLDLLNECELPIGIDDVKEAMGR